MLAWRDTLSETAAALKAYRLRALLASLGITLGVATVITVMTLIQGANLYVETKIANLGTNVFQISRLPFNVADYDLLIKALRFKRLTLEDMQAVAARCRHCLRVGAEVRASVRSRYRDRELTDTALIGHTANMADIDTRTVALGRYFTEAEERRSAQVCLIGSRLVEEFFAGTDPVGHMVRLGEQEFLVIGTYEKIGSVLGQDQDNFAVIPMHTFLKLRGSRSSVTLSVQAAGAGPEFEQAQDEARLALRAARRVPPDREDDFFIGTKESYLALWRRISAAFFAVYVMVSSIAALVGGIVVMNVMLVSVAERTKEIGVRRASGATQGDIVRQFLAESLAQCLLGGMAGVAAGFAVALLLDNYTPFPAAVRGWVVVFGLGFSCLIGLFFGIYPATRAARLDPVAALRAE
ncbi:MAG: ABC transporter permease [Bryobacterales bacterium]|nr:ABC transporter permease [Bryobacterales bacterium]